MRGLPTKGGYFNTMVYEEEPEESDEEEEQLRRQEEERAAIESDERLKEIRRKYPVQRNIWIVKPGENTNRGNGISVCSELNEIRSLVLSSRDGAADSTFIIQRYIENPLLIHGRKFDFRCYGVLASVNGGLRGYFYEDAYIRTSCKEFDIEDVHNKFVHLTNDAVQKYSADYGKYENGNKLSLQDFQKYLRATYPLLGIEVWRDIMPQIRKLVTDSYRAVYGKIDPFRLHNSFELFGYDFMLDENFRLYLIEVNTNPCLEMSCPLLARIIPEVLDNTFRLVLDPIFPAPSGDQQHTRKYQLIPQEIKYSLVFDEEIDGPELKAAALREPKRPPSDPAQSNPLQGGAAGPIGVIDEIESD
jgi:tubulin monoglycylase TTLL3/8